MARAAPDALDAAIVLVAHDRWFLEAVGTSVLELEAGRGQVLPGAWHAWRRERAARELALGRAIERQQAEIERLERFVTRFRAGTRARQAQSRAKRLDKIERIDASASDGAALAVRVQAAGAQRPGRVRAARWRVISATGDKLLLDDAELWLERGEHVSLVGPNGAGKTTLIETLAGPPRARRRASCAPATTSRSATCPSTPRSWPPALRAPCSRRQHATGLTPTRRGRCSGGSCSPARRRRSRWTACPAASAGGCRWRSSSSPARTC